MVFQLTSLDILSVVNNKNNIKQFHLERQLKNHITNNNISCYLFDCSLTDFEEKVHT